MTNNLDSDQDRHYVRLDLGPNCFQRLSADDTSRERVKIVVRCIYGGFLFLLCFSDGAHWKCLIERLLKNTITCFLVKISKLAIEP